MIIDLECAYKGVQLLPAYPQSIEKPDDIDEDLTVYKMPNFSISGVDAVEKVMDFLNGIIGSVGRVNYVSGPSYKHSFRAAKEPIVLRDFDSQEAYSVERLKVVGVALKNYEAKKKNYEDIKSEYDTLAGERKCIVDELQGRISDCVAAEREYERMKSIAKRYMKLAGGVQEIAVNFMVDAYKENEETIRANFEAWVVEFVTEKMTEGDSVNG
jgi:hypothetical protein